MFGIVLWSATKDDSAVVWCEDQGDLAYLRGGVRRDGTGEGERVLAGDLLQFDLMQEGDMRMIRNARVIESGHLPSLPDSLRNAGPAPVDETRASRCKPRAVPVSRAVAAPVTPSVTGSVTRPVTGPVTGPGAFSGVPLVSEAANSIEPCSILPVRPAERDNVVVVPFKGRRSSGQRQVRAGHH